MNIVPMTLGAARLLDAAKFDAAIERAVQVAVEKVGAVEVARALQPQPYELSSRQVIAA